MILVITLSQFLVSLVLGIIVFSGYVGFEYYKTGALSKGRSERNMTEKSAVSEKKKELELIQENKKANTIAQKLEAFEKSQNFDNDNITQNEIIEKQEPLIESQSMFPGESIELKETDEPQIPEIEIPEPPIYSSDETINENGSIFKEDIEESEDIKIPSEKAIMEMMDVYKEEKNKFSNVVS